jgi:hypothetical protein
MSEYSSTAMGWRVMAYGREAPDTENAPRPLTSRKRPPFGGVDVKEIVSGAGDRVNPRPSAWKSGHLKSTGKPVIIE